MKARSPKRRHATLPCADNRTFVLIHGAWHGGWVWTPVAEGLRAKGHRVYTPSLTGLGDRKHLLRPGINLDTHCDDIVNLIEMEDLHEIVLVGWSYGGFVMGEVLSRIPDRIASLVYLDAHLPARGRNLLSYSQSTTTPEKAVQKAILGDDVTPLDFSAMGVKDQKVIAFCSARVSPQPTMTYLQNSKAPAELPSHIPHTYILATDSPITIFREIFESIRDLDFVDAQEVHADHLLMLTAPDITLDILLNAR